MFWASHFSVRRPVAVGCVFIALAVFGLLSWRQLGLDAFPDIEVPFVTVSVEYPGAGPDEIEVSVAKVIEDAAGSVDGLKTMKTTCMENSCRILMEFHLGVNVDAAAQDVRERIEQVRDDLPAGAENPVIAKFDPNASPVAQLALTGNLPIDDLYDYADETLSDKLSVVPGVAEVKLAGGENLEVLVTLNHERLAAAGLNVLQVLQKLGEANLKLPAGRIRQGEQEVGVTYDSEFKSFAELGDLEVGPVSGRRVYLRDVAAITLESKEKRSLAFYNGVPAVSLEIIKKGEANAVKVIDGVRDVVKKLEADRQLPSGMQLVWVNDSGNFIRASVDDAWSGILIGIALTSLVLLAFLRAWRPALLAALAIPLSVLVALPVMRMCGYTFNMFTLLALGSSVGTLAANSIVVIESIAARIAAKEEVHEAAESGVGDVAAPVFASAITNVVVFGPVALMVSLVGRFIAPFAVTMTIAALVSLAVSFTLTPALAVGMLKSGLRPPGAVYDFCEKHFATSLGFALRRPVWVIAATAAVTVWAFVWLLPAVGTTFVPENDRGEFTVKLEFPVDFSLATTLGRTSSVAQKLRNLPGVLDTLTVIGQVKGTAGQATEGVYLVEITVLTVPSIQRNATLEDTKQALRKALSGLSGCIVSINIPSPMGGSSAMMEMEIAGDDLQSINNAALAAAGKLQNSGLANDIDTNVRPGKPEIVVVPNRMALRRINMASSAVGTLLRGSVDGIKQGVYKVGPRSFDIRVKLGEFDTYRELPALAVESQKGRARSLDTVAALRSSTMPSRIDRTDRRRVAKVFANPVEGVGLGDLVAAVERIGKELASPGEEVRFTGMTVAMREAFADFMQTIMLAVLLTYLAVAASMESWLKPLLVMFTIPPAAVGMLIALWLAGLPLSIFGLLGFVMLTGIVVNNAILVVDELRLVEASGKRGAEAMQEATRRRFRPILMTTLAAALGVAPLAFGGGLGFETRASCGIPVIGGLLFSAVLSLYLVPALYVLVARRKSR